MTYTWMSRIHHQAVNIYTAAHKLQLVETDRVNGQVIGLRHRHLRQVHFIASDLVVSGCICHSNEWQILTL